MILRTAILCPALALAACQGDTDAPSAEQNREMDRAAEMLDEAPNGLSQIDDSGLAAEQDLNAAEDSGSGNE